MQKSLKQETLSSTKMLNCKLRNFCHRCRLRTSMPTAEFILQKSLKRESSANINGLSILFMPFIDTRAKLGSSHTSRKYLRLPPISRL